MVRVMFLFLGHLPPSLPASLPAPISILTYVNHTFRKSFVVHIYSGDYLLLVPCPALLKSGVVFYLGGGRRAAEKGPFKGVKTV